MRNPVHILFWDVRPRLKSTVLVALLSLAFVAGTGVNNKHPRIVDHWHGITSISPLLTMPGYSEGVPESIAYWEKEVSRRFPDAVIYVTHGGDFMGEWAAMDAEGGLERTVDVVHRLQVQYPGRIIVLIECNPGHYHLKIPGVYHALDSVWFVPDKEADNTQAGRHDHQEDVGNIYEFVDT